MHILWLRQVDLLTILGSLPAGSWVVGADRDFVREKLIFPLVTFWASPHLESLSRNLSKDEWLRLKKYAARITALNVSLRSRLSTSLEACISVETIQLLKTESKQGTFWPGLRQLRCNMGWEIVPFISLFLTPAITDLDLLLPRESTELLQPTFSLLADTCCQLQSLGRLNLSPEPFAGVSRS